MKMIEKVARALEKELPKSLVQERGLRAWSMMLARTAIEATRLEVDNPLVRELDRFADHDVWYWHNQLIDAALKEE